VPVLSYLHQIFCRAASLNAEAHQYFTGKLNTLDWGWLVTRAYGLLPLSWRAPYLLAFFLHIHVR
jgi:hypothetical protein